MKVILAQLIVLLISAFAACSANPNAQRVGAKISTAPVLHVAELRSADGSLLDTSQYYFNSAGEKVWHGLEIVFNSDGSKRMEIHYANNVPHGSTTEWDPL